MKKLFALGAAVVLAGGGLVAGYVPEHHRRMDAERKLHAAEVDLSSTRSLLTLHVLHDRIVALLEATSDASRFEEAQALSTQFFDLVRDQSTSATDTSARTAFSEVLTSRDAVTAGLARHDAGVRSILGHIRDALQQLLEQSASPPQTAAAN